MGVGDDRAGRAVRRSGIVAMAAVFGIGAWVGAPTRAAADLSVFCTPEQVEQAQEMGAPPPVFPVDGLVAVKIDHLHRQAASGYVRACLFPDTEVFPTPQLLLHGTITQADADVMEAIFGPDTWLPQALRPTPDLLLPRRVAVLVNSPGGDLGAATEIGRILRQFFSIAFVHEQCMSACIAVVAGANIRIVGVPLGLHSHRPGGEGYTGLTLSEARQRYNATLDDLAAFLGEGGVSPDVVDIMRSTPSTSIRFVQGAEAEALGFHTIEPAFREYHLDRIGQDCGPAARQRFAEFLAQADICVPQIPVSQPAIECFGTSLQALQADLAQANCWFAP